ncbi:MAG: DUF3422 family protein, partial [Pseudomonadota bacterium]
MTLPTDHQNRIQLNNEVHARPPESLVTPCAISYLALYSAGQRGEDFRAITALAEMHG